MKKLKALLSIIIILTFLVSMTPLIASAAGEPVVKIEQANTSFSGVYKLAMTVTLPETSGIVTTTALSISYDNTVIIPVVANTGVPITAALTSQSTPFTTQFSNGVPPAVWVTAGGRTAFEVSALSYEGEDLSDGLTALEFYFSFVSGKTAADMNVGTFLLIPGSSSLSKIYIGTNSYGVEYYFGNSSNPDSIVLDSFTYTNSNIRPVKELSIASIADVMVPDLYALNDPIPKTTAATASPVLTVTDIVDEIIPYGNSQYPTVAWSITSNPDSGKISINPTTGVLSVAPGAAAGTVTIQAAAGGKTATRTVDVNRDMAEARLLTISGEDSITVPTGSPITETYTMSVVDQYGSAYSGLRSWSVGALKTGVELSTTGVLTVDNTAALGSSVSYEIIGTCYGATATKTVTISRAASVPTTLTLTGGGSSIDVPADTAGSTPDTYSGFAAAVVDQYGVTYTAGTITWSIAGAPTGVTINSSTGVVSVTNAAKAAITETGTTYTVTATVSGTAVSDIGSITVKRAAAVATSVVIYNNSAFTSATGATDTLVIPTTSTPNTKQYYAQELDQYSTPTAATPAWTFATAVAGKVEHNGTGLVTVTEDAVVDSTYTITATSGALNASVVITVKDIAVNWAPVETSIGSATITYGQTNSAAFTSFPGGAGAGTATAVTTLNGTFSIVNPTDIQTAGPKTITVNFTVTTAGAYSGVVISKVFDITVNPKPITVTVNAASREYGAANPTFSIATPAAGVLVGTDNVASLGLALSSAATASSAPGNYEVTGTATTTNYIVTVATNSALTVTRAALTLTGTPSFTAILANHANNVSASALTAAVQAANPTLTASYANGSDTLSATWSLTSPAFNAKGGTYTFTAVLTPANPTNFSYSGSTTLSVTVTAVTVTSHTYGPASLLKAKAEVDAATSMADLGLPTTVAVSFDNSVTGGPYTILSWNLTLATLKGINVSTSDQMRNLIPTVDFPAWATIDLSGLVTELTITSKYPVTVDVTPPAGVTYGTALGDPTPGQTDAGNGTEPSPSWDYLYTGTTRAGASYSSATKPTAAGTYTVRATLVSDTYSGNATSASFTILPKTLTSGMIDITGTYSFTGNAVIPTYTVSDGTLMAASDYTTAITDNVNAGTATITATATATGNYTGTATQTFIIGKAAAPAAGAVSREHPVDTTATGTIDVSRFLPSNRGDTTYAFVGVNTGGSVDISSVDAAGVFTYTTVNTSTDETLDIVISATMQNYANTTITITIDIVDKTVPVVTSSPVVSGSIKYGQTLSALTITVQFDDGFGTEVAGTVIWDSPTYTPDAGTTSVAWTFVPSDTTLYTTVSDTITITIGKAVPSGTPTITNITQTGKTLADANLTEPSGGFTNPYNSGIIVPGTLTWDAGDAQTVAANAEYAWTFTPDDLVNYEVATGKFKPYTVSTGSGAYDSYGSGSPSAPASNTIPGSGGGTKVNVPITVDNTTGKVTLQLNAKTTNDLISDAQKSSTAPGGGQPKVVFDLAGVKNAKSAVLNVDAAGSFADAGVAVTMVFPAAEVTFSPEALKDIAAVTANGATPVTIEVQEIPMSSLSGMQAAQVKGYETVISIDVFVGTAKVDVPLTVSIPYKLKGGENPNAVCVWFMDDDGTLTKLNGVYDAATGMMTFTIDHQSYFVVGYDPVALWVNIFNDVAPSAWYYDAIAFSNYNHLFNGVGGSVFSPNTGMTSAMFVTVLWNLEGRPAPKGEIGSEWFAGAVKWAEESGLVDGLGGEFKPRSDITRQEMAVILYNYAAFAGYELPKNREAPAYSDTALIDSWAANAVQALSEAGVMSGVGNNIFSPQADSTRAHVAQLFKNFMRLVVEE